MKKLVLHLGAHRCGSTAIQTMLARNRDTLRANGVDVIVRDDMEHGFFDLRRLHRYSRHNPLWHIKLRGFAAALKASPYNMTVASEENLIGTMPGVMRADFYPYFPALMSGLAALQVRLTDAVDIHPRLVVRRQDHYIESVYAFRVSRGLTLDFSTFLHMIDTGSVSWLRMLNTAKSFAGQMTIKFAVLEAWPRITAAQDAAKFLDLPVLNGQSNQRLNGNKRHSKTVLALMLACNRAGVDLSLLQAVGINSDTVPSTNFEKDVLLVELAAKVPRRALDKLRTALTEMLPLGFSGQERADFLSVYSADNLRFLSDDMVAIDPDVWDGVS